MTHMYIVRKYIYMERMPRVQECEKDIWHKNSIESNDMRVFPFETRKGPRLGMSLSKKRERECQARDEHFL